MARNIMNKVIKYNNRDELVEKVASNISNDLTNALDSSERVTFAVPGGSTPGPILKKLSEI